MDDTRSRRLRQAAADPELNATAASLLGFLQEAPCSGYDLEVTIDGSIGRFWNVTRSQIYRELRVLEQAGLVTAAAPGARARRVYALTARGRAAFADWLARPAGRDLIRIPFLVHVFFADALPRGVLAARVRERRAVHEAQRDEYQRRLPAIEASAPLPALTMRYGLRYAEAMLAWLDDVDARLTRAEPFSAPPG